MLLEREWLKNPWGSRSLARAHDIDNLQAPTVAQSNLEGNVESRRVITIASRQYSRSFVPSVRNQGWHQSLICINSVRSICTDPALKKTEY